MSLSFTEMAQRAEAAEAEAREKERKARDLIAEGKRRGDAGVEERGHQLLREAGADLAHAERLRHDPDSHLTDAERRARGAREIAFGIQGRRR